MDVSCNILSGNVLGACICRAHMNWTEQRRKSYILCNNMLQPIRSGDASINSTEHGFVVSWCQPKINLLAAAAASVAIRHQFRSCILGMLVWLHLGVFVRLFGSAQKSWMGVALALAKWAICWDWYFANFKRIIKHLSFCTPWIVIEWDPVWSFASPVKNTDLFRAWMKYRALAFECSQRYVRSIKSNQLSSEQSFSHRIVCFYDCTTLTGHILLGHRFIGTIPPR